MSISCYYLHSGLAPVMESNRSVLLPVSSFVSEAAAYFHETVFLVVFFGVVGLEPFPLATEAGTSDVLFTRSRRLTD